MRAFSAASAATFIRTFIRAFTASAVFVVLVSVPAYPQEENKAPLTRRSEAQQKDDAEIDKAYRNATKGDVKANVKADPWRIVRPAEGDKSKR
jgi:hypothetical protein